MAKKPRKFGAGGMSTMEKRITELDKPTRPVPPAAKKPPPKKPSGSASPPIPDWMLRGDNEDKAKGERGYKKYAKGGSVKRLAAGGLGSPPVPQPSTLPFKGAPTPAQGTMFNDARTAPPQMGGPGGPQMRGGPGSRPTMPQRPMMGGEDRARADRFRQAGAAQIAMLKQNALRDQVWGPGSPNSLNPVVGGRDVPVPPDMDKFVSGPPPNKPLPTTFKEGTVGANAVKAGNMQGTIIPGDTGRTNGGLVGTRAEPDYDDMAAAKSSGALASLSAERAGPGPMTPERQAALSAGMANLPTTKPGYKKGGVVKKFAKGGTVKKSGASRGDGIAKRGRTKGKMR